MKIIAPIILAALYVGLTLLVYIFGIKLTHLISILLAVIPVIIMYFIEPIRTLIIGIVILYLSFLPLFANYFFIVRVERPDTSFISMLSEYHWYMLFLPALAAVVASLAMKHITRR